MGMSSYSKWYFEAQVDTLGPLLPHFGSDSDQVEIAQQAQNDTSTIGASFLTSKLGFLPNNNYAIAEDLIAKLGSEHKPQVLFMSKVNWYPSLTWNYLVQVGSGLDTATR